MKASVFLGLLVKQPHLRQAQVLEQLDADAVVARVGLVAQGQVGFDRVEPLILQLVGLDLFDQADAAAFLRQIDQHAGAFLADHSSAMCSWSPQSQRSESSKSPVKHDECNRTSGATAFVRSPITSTIGCCASYFTP